MRCRKAGSTTCLTKYENCLFWSNKIVDEWFKPTMCRQRLSNTHCLGITLALLQEVNAVKRVHGLQEAIENDIFCESVGNLNLLLFNIYGLVYRPKHITTIETSGWKARPTDMIYWSFLSLKKVRIVIIHRRIWLFAFGVSQQYSCILPSTLFSGTLPWYLHPSCRTSYLCGWTEDIEQTGDVTDKAFCLLSPTSVLTMKNLVLFLTYSPPISRPEGIHSIPLHQLIDHVTLYLLKISFMT